LAKADAKRAADFGALLKDEILENVDHSLITSTLPKMLRGYFMRNESFSPIWPASPMRRRSCGQSALSAMLPEVLEAAAELAAA
jgi:hypothetical protein